MKFDSRFEIDGECKALIAGQATWYFCQLASGGRGLFAALRAAMAVLQPNLGWYRSESMRQTRPLTAEVVDRILRTPPAVAMARDEWGYILHSGPSSEDLGPWSLNVYMEPAGLKRRSGHLHVTVPTEWLEEDPERFAAWVQELSQCFEFRSGHAGYGVHFDEGDMSVARDAQVRGWLGRYLGLDARDLAMSGDMFCKHVKGAGWLTMLDSKFVKQLHGVNGLRQRFQHHPVSIVEMSNGVVLQAGPVPLLGDVNRRQDLLAQAEVSRVLRPVRIEGGLSIRSFAEDEDADAWLARLDDVGLSP